MRTLLRLSVIAGLLALPLAANAQTPSIAITGDVGGNILASGGEVYSIKLKGSGYADWQGDLSAKGGGLFGLIPGDVAGDTIQVLGGNFSDPEAPTDVVYIIVTLPDGRMSIDSGDLSTGFNFMDTVCPQTVGNAIDGSLTLPGDQSAYTVDFGAGAVNFPALGEQGGTPQSINVAFAPIAELNTDVAPCGGTWGGAFADPGNATGTGGLIVGYNVYRMVDGGGGAPDAATLGTAANFVAQVPFDFDLSMADSSPAAPGSDAPTDPNPQGDLFGLQNLDGTAWSGDEILLFQDGAANPDGSGRVGPPPTLDGSTSYWYGFQPVLAGDPSDFTNVRIANQAAADHSLDVDGDTVLDGVDLDRDGNADFYSPSGTGLGLTNGSVPLLSPVTWSDPTRLPSTGRVELAARVGRTGVELSITGGMESNVSGYNVWRIVGESRERVNDEMIVARGATGSSYELSDDRFSGRRARAGLSYEVEVVYNDGTASQTFGPFQLAEETRVSPRRR